MYKFHNYCFSKCPHNIASDPEKGFCSTENYYYQKSMFELEFLDVKLCNEKYPYLFTSPSAKEGQEEGECVEGCKNTNKPYLFGKNCVEASVCTSGVRNFTSNDPLFEKGLGTCNCPNQWYLDPSGNGIICLNETRFCYNAAASWEYNYEVYGEKQCVKKCPAQAPKMFNYYCYKTCAEAGTINGGITLIDDNRAVKDENGCICSGTWTRTLNTTSKLYEYVCYTTEYCAEIGSAKESTTLWRINSQRECVNTTVCPGGYDYSFNRDCYEKCPNGTKIDPADKLNCICEKLWYNKTETNRVPAMVCMPGLNYCRKNTIVPTNQYLLSHTNECVSACPAAYPRLFNYECKSKCPFGTKESTLVDGSSCECDKAYGKWYKKEAPDGVKESICGLEKCPDNWYYLEDTFECMPTKCKDGYYDYGSICYKECPKGTEVQSGHCVYTGLKAAKDEKELISIFDTDVVKYILPELAAREILIDKPKLTLQAYKLNKNKNGEEKKLIKSDRKELSMINIDKCINDVYTANDLKDTDDVIVAKYDLKETSKKTLISPTEYAFYSSKDGKKLDLSVCQGNSVTISYSMTHIFEDAKTLYNETYYKQLTNLYQKAKEIHTTSPEIDIFNYGSSIYEEFCKPFSIDGKDVTFEDRRNLLYPSIPICDEGCVPNHIDYTEDRVYCDCLFKVEIDLERKNNQGLSGHQWPSEETKAIQRGPSSLPAMKCLSNMKDDKKNMIEKNPGFFTTVIVGGVEVILVVVTAFAGYGKVANLIGGKIGMVSGNGRQLQMSEVSMGNNDFSSGRKFGGKKKMKKKGMSNPPRKDDNEIIDVDDIKLGNKGSSDSGRRSDNEISVDVLEYDGKQGKASNGCLDKLRNEEMYMRLGASRNFEENGSSTGTIIFAEILDKVYVSRTFLFSKKYDMLSLRVSLYLLYHVFILTLVTLFFNIKTISKIYTKENFPGVDYYLLYGFLTLLITFVLYRLLYCLISNNDKVSEIIERKNFYSKNGIADTGLMEESYDDVKCKIKAKIIVFFVIEFVVLVFAFLFLTTFCGIYTKTKTVIFKGYGFGLIEILVIKIIYGIILGGLRKAAIGSKNLGLYNFVYFFDNYLS